MALTYGFYNSLRGDRKYNAEQVSEIFDGVLKDGIIPSQGQLFAVSSADNGMQINVGTGRAWFDHTWTKNDSVMVLTVPLSDISRPRYDAVVLEVNHNDDIRANSIKIVQGEPLTNPVKPTLVNTEKVHQYPLAYILVEGGVEEIKASKIENWVGREPTVFATGVLETVSIDQLWNQWEGEWHDWFENIKLQLTENVVTNLQYQIDQKIGLAERATTAEATAGTNDTHWMTPLKTKQATQAFWNANATGQNVGYITTTTDKTHKYRLLEDYILKYPVLLGTQTFTNLVLKGTRAVTFSYSEKLQSGNSTLYDITLTINMYDPTTFALLDTETRTFEASINYYSGGQISGNLNKNFYYYDDSHIYLSYITSGGSYTVVVYTLTSSAITYSKAITITSIKLYQPFSKLKYLGDGVSPRFYFSAPITTTGSGSSIVASTYGWFVLNITSGTLRAFTMPEKSGAAFNYSYTNFNFCKSNVSYTCWVHGETSSSMGSAYLYISTVSSSGTVTHPSTAVASTNWFSSSRGLAPIALDESLNYLYVQTYYTGSSSSDYSLIVVNFATNTTVTGISTGTQRTDIVCAINNVALYNRGTLGLQIDTFPATMNIQPIGILTGKKLTTSTSNSYITYTTTAATGPFPPNSGIYYQNTTTMVRFDDTVIEGEVFKHD